jgi:hypothetical protein
MSSAIVQAFLSVSGPADQLRFNQLLAPARPLAFAVYLDYKWQKQLEPADPEVQPAGDMREFTLGKEISQLKRLLAEKTQEVDFFKGALQKVEARRRNSEDTGARASTTRSGK